ncbi:RpiB/LacA/LacB family sugar-phosphate isomerase [Amycolatopsis sp. NPDC051903]|uniref:RpiB/LacA/LacB family sugar-phosphate isomerase n=1 Tax=Amycolatopsis sp. NPDC051903 TaxID=3363936 RepID=UPI00379FB449
MRIAIAADHNGVGLKARLSAWLTAHGHEVDDRGSHSETDIVDYPPLCADVSRRVGDGRAEAGVIVGGSGQGEVIACNKIRGVRAGLGHTSFMVEISRGNNDANVLVLGTKVITDDEAERLLALWLSTPFKGGRHQQRVDQITALEA